MSSEVVGTVDIRMPDGVNATIEMTQDFVNMVRQAHNLSTVQDINEDHVRSFLIEALNNALKEEANE